MRPVKDQLGHHRARRSSNPALEHVYFDISWDEAAKYIVADARSRSQAIADLINRHPDRFLFGTDEVAPTEPGERTSRSTTITRRSSRS